jgi:hypothetical protein
MVDHDGLFETYMHAMGFKPPDLPTAHPTPTNLDTADRTSRYWTSRHVGALRPGSAAHKREVCRMFVETFNPYRPSVIAWPKLTPEALQRVASLPIWDIAVHTESRARLRFAAYANAVDDADIKAAVMLNAWEESRHKEVLSQLVAAYGIAQADEPPFKHPRDPEWFYLVTGYCECIDSFFAFGLFELARRSGFFPVELVETFEPVVQEECRHILLFANLVAWQRANLPWWRRALFELRVAAVWGSILWERLVLARNIGGQGHGAGQDTNFTATSAQTMTPVEIQPRDLMMICLEENDRRFAGYDGRLVRPTLVPRLVRFALALTRPWARKRRRPAAQPATWERGSQER